MNNRVRHLIRKLVQEASKTEDNEYYIDTELINEVEVKKNESKKIAPIINKKVPVKN
jgi:hypothetical protein